MLLSLITTKVSFFEIYNINATTSYEETANGVKTHKVAVLGLVGSQNPTCDPIRSLLILFQSNHF